MISVLDGYAICTECLIWVCNGDASGMDEGTESRVCDAALDERGHWVDASHEGDSDAEGWFSWKPCDRCHSRLGGQRFHAALLVNERGGDL